MVDDEEGAPTSEDPFGFLGVDDQVDQRALKRAYAKMARRYKPEHAPEMFKKVRAAYEAALVQLEYQAFLGSFDDPDDDDDGDGDEVVELEVEAGLDNAAGSAPQRAEPAQPTEPAVEPAARLAARFSPADLLDDDTPADTETPAAAAGPDVAVDPAVPDGPPAWGRFARAWLAGDRPTALDHLEAGLVAGEQLASQLVDNVALDVLGSLMARPGLTWSVIRLQRDEWARNALFSARAMGLQAAGDVAPIVKDIESPHFGRDRMGSEGIDQVLLHVMCFTVWRHPGLNTRLAGLVETTVAPDHYLWDVHDQLEALRPSMRALLAAPDPPPPPVVELMERGMVVDYSERTRLVRAWHADLKVNLLYNLGVMEWMERNEPGLLRYLEAVLTVDEIADTDAELPESVQRVVGETLEQIEKRYAKHSRARGVALIIAIVLVVAIALRRPGLGALVVAALTVVAVPRVARRAVTDNRYERRMRPALAILLLKYETTVASLEGFLQLGKRRYPITAETARERGLETDLVLRVLQAQAAAYAGQREHAEER